MIILETALETAGLTYVFPDGNGIKNIAFQVKRGENLMHCMAANHAGKSVLLQTIIGTLRSQAGTLKFIWQYRLSEGAPPDWVCTTKACDNRLSVTC